MQKSHLTSNIHGRGKLKINNSFITNQSRARVGFLENFQIMYASSQVPNNNRMMFAKCLKVFQIFLYTSEGLTTPFPNPVTHAIFPKTFVKFLPSSHTWSVFRRQMFENKDGTVSPFSDGSCFIYVRSFVLRRLVFSFFNLVIYSIRARVRQTRHGVIIYLFGRWSRKSRRKKYNRMAFVSFIGQI